MAEVKNQKKIERGFSSSPRPALMKILGAGKHHPMLSIETGYLSRSGNRRFVPKTFDPFANRVALVALAVRFAAGKVPCVWLLTGLETIKGHAGG